MLLLHTLGKLDNWHCSQKPLLPSGTRRENTSVKHSTGTQGGWGSPPPTPCSTHHKTSNGCQIPSAPPGRQAAPSPHNPNRGQGHSWQPSSLRQRAPGPGEKEQLRAALLQEALSSCRAGPPCLVLSPAVNATQRVANAAWGHEDNPHLAPALPLWREQLLKPPLRGCCCSGTHKPRPYKEKKRD